MLINNDSFFLSGVWFMFSILFMWQGLLVYVGQLWVGWDALVVGWLRRIWSQENKNDKNRYCKDILFNAPTILPIHWFQFINIQSNEIVSWLQPGSISDHKEPEQILQAILSDALMNLSIFCFVGFTM